MRKDAAYQAKALPNLITFHQACLQSCVTAQTVRVLKKYADSSRSGWPMFALIETHCRDFTGAAYAAGTVEQRSGPSDDHAFAEKNLPCVNTSGSRQLPHQIDGTPKVPALMGSARSVLRRQDPFRKAQGSDEPEDHL